MSWLPKLDLDKLGRNDTVMSNFGDWKDNLDKLHDDFVSAQPYPHVVIENFFNKEVVDKLVKEFPAVDDDHWHHYLNPIEIKVPSIHRFQRYKDAMDKLELMPLSYNQMFYNLNEPQFIQAMSKISGVSNLECDPYLHGSGLHSYPTTGTLKMHLDYASNILVYVTNQVHPKTKKERRLNLLVYLNQEWKPEWCGDLELWSSDEQGNMKECVKKIQPLFNTAVLFQTSDYSWHGLPDYIRCPKDVSRKSIAVYYVSEQRPNLKNGRYKAHFALRPTDTMDKRIQELIDIRDTRLISDEDLRRIYPDWKKSVVA